MKSVLLLFLLASTGQGGEVGASYVEKETLEECKASIVALRQILKEPKYIIHQAQCLQSDQKISEYEHPGAEEEGGQAPRYVYLNTVSDGRLIVAQTASKANCDELLKPNDGIQSWCATSTQQLLN